MMNSFFFDTYAFFELNLANPEYKRFENQAIITTKMNIMEYHYSILKEEGETEAEKKVRMIKNFIVEFGIGHIKAANKFKLKHKEKKLSYVDCLGYAVALSYGVPFVTGDKEFIDMPNVEFVK